MSTPTLSLSNPSSTPTTATTMSYTVYLIIETGIPRDHHALFAETHEAGPQTGHVYNVQGEIQNGMVYEAKTIEEPEKSPVFAERRRIGTISKDDYPRFIAVCQSIPVPKKQFEGARRLYPKERLRRCQEWAREAIDALVEQNVVLE